jgi:hypothetical protein
MFSACNSVDAEEAELILSQRIFGCEVIQKMGMHLRLPQVVVSMACVSFHRFYNKRSMRKVSNKRSSWAKALWVSDSLWVSPPKGTQ